MDTLVWAELQRLICSSSVRTLNAIWMTYQERWTIETDGERERESQGTSCYQLDLMIINVNIAGSVELYTLYKYIANDFFSGEKHWE